jgi:hypothetical protein
LNGDERLAHFSRLDKAKELLEHEPGLKAMLQNAWKKGSFKEVRQLGGFAILFYALSL